MDFFHTCIRGTAPVQIGQLLLLSRQLFQSNWHGGFFLRHWKTSFVYFSENEMKNFWSFVQLINYGSILWESFQMTLFDLYLKFDPMLLFRHSVQVHNLVRQRYSVWGFVTLTTPTNFQWSGLYDHLKTAQEGCPYKRRGVVSTAVGASKVRSTPAGAILHIKLALPQQLSRFSFAFFKENVNIGPRNPFNISLGVTLLIGLPTVTALPLNNTN